MNVILEPASEVEEIVQNVRMILATPKGSAPLHRAFGVSATALDSPLPAAQAQLTADFIEAVARFEPRAEPVNVSFELDNLTGNLTPRMTIRITTEAELVNV